MASGGRKAENELYTAHISKVPLAPPLHQEGRGLQHATNTAFCGRTLETLIELPYAHQTTPLTGNDKLVYKPVLEGRGLQGSTNLSFLGGD